MAEDSSIETPRWRRTPEERPRQILDAALAVFGAQGLAGSRIDDIADKAGISKGTVYLYFPSKDDLFREVIRDTFAGILEVADAVELTDDAADDLKKFCRNYWLYLRSPRFETAYRLITAELHAFPELFREYGTEVREPLLQLVRRVLDRGVKAEVFRKGNNVVRARMLLALLWQNSVWCARRAGAPDLENRSDNAVLNEVISFFMDAIAIET